MERSDEAVAETEQALKLATGLYLAAGKVYYGSRHYDRAIELSRQAIQMSPIKILAHFQLGWAYVAESRLQVAVESFEKATQSSERDSGTLMSQA